MYVRLLIAGVATVLLTAVVAQAQPAGAAAAATQQQVEGGTPSYIRIETPEQRRARVGDVDPGANPDPNQVFVRRGTRWNVHRFERQFAKYDAGDGLVRPMANVNFAFEIYQQNEKYVWVWVPTAQEIEDFAQTAAATQKSTIYTEPQIAYLKRIAPEFTELTPRESPKVIRFAPSSEGLPNEGSWRNSPALADMNGDGHIDIIAPPERGSRSVMPAVFLGDGKGGWTAWSAARWPAEMEYGSVTAADFNDDKIMDLAFGQHLQKPLVLLGDGKGGFTISSKGIEGDFASRRVIATDVDGDGDTDLLALWEGPAPGQETGEGRIRAYINEGKARSWKAVNVAAPEHLVAGDWMTVGRFNKDRYPDIVASNIYFQRPETLYESTGRARWNLIDWQDGVLVPYLSTYYATATGRFGSRDRDDAIVTYLRAWPEDVSREMVQHPPITSIAGLDRISFAGKQPVRKPIMRFESDRPILGLAAADFDRDGKQDLLFTRNNPREAVLLLGDGKGNFSKAVLEGLDLASNPNYDLTVRDVNGDGLPDVLVMYESTSESPFGRQNGSIRFFLNQGVATSR